MLRKMAPGCVVRGAAILGVQQYACGCGSTYALPGVIFLPLGRIRFRNGVMWATWGGGKNYG